MIYFTRHGESEANIERVFSNTGFKHPLTERGVEQANRLSIELTGAGIERVFSSPVLRAIQTASIVSRNLRIPYFEVHESLREYDVGELEGMFDEDSWGKYFENERGWNDESKRGDSLINGESFTEIQARFAGFMRQLRERGLYDSNVLIIAHGGLLKIGLPKAVANLDYTFTSANPIRNCGIIKCRADDGAIICHQWCEIAIV